MAVFDAVETDEDVKYELHSKYEVPILMDI